MRRTKFAVLAVGVGVLAVTAPSSWATLATVNNTNNVLLSKSVNSSPTIPGFEAPYAVDGKVRATNASIPGGDQDHGLIFSDGFSLNVFGFNSAIEKFRIYTLAGDVARTPTAVQIYSSLSPVSSLNAAAFSNDWGVFNVSFTNAAVMAAGETNGTDNLYAEVPLALPAGTQSVMINFYGETQGARIAEFQAFAPVPEPASAGLLASAAATFALSRRRRRSAR